MVAAFLAGLLVLCLSPVSANDDSPRDRQTVVSGNTVNSVEGEGFDLNNKDIIPSGTQARPLGELELAIQEYLMYFNAYREAQQSTNPAEHEKSPQLLRAYRVAYAKALKMMRDDKLIHPMIPQNPLKLYMEKAKDAILGDPKARRRIYKEIRKAIKAALKDGKSADEIVSIIKEMIATANANWERGRQAGDNSNQDSDDGPSQNVVNSGPTPPNPPPPLSPPSGPPQSPGQPETNNLNEINNL